ncbi:major facilitator superfamily domain-containing protein [Xylogone sp. PMI_703]|nr:major facilitator superfamily domain-containing protein [Xylogone sp. PMI_703]
MSSAHQNSPDDSSDSISRESSEKGDVTTKVPEAILQDAELITSKGNIVTKDGIVISTQENDASLSTNVFADPEVRAYYVGVYEKAKYECRHVFDPDLTWSAEEEKKLVRKLDWHVCLWACVMFFSLQIDRGNINQAVSGTFLKDLHLNTNDFNLGNTVFLVSFLLAELPSQLVSKKIGPDRWIPTQMVLWSIVAMSQAALKGRPGFLATRALMGILEGGFIPDLVLWLSYFYTSRELPTRLSFFWTALSVTGIVTSLLAFAIFHLEGYRSIAGWRWLFLLEGLVTLLLGFASFFLMPASAVQTKTWFRPKGWFTDRELSIVVNRVLRDDPSKGDMHNRQAITPKRLWTALQDYDLWPIYALGLLCFIPQSPPSTYMTLTLRSLGFSTFNTNLLTIPSSVFHIFTLLGITWVSEKLNQRALVAVFQSLWTLPCIVALYTWPDLIKNAWGTYALMVVLLSYPYCHAINVAWASKNSNNVGSRSVSTALYNMSVQLGNIIAANIYRDDDKPRYKHGNRVLIAINVVVVFLFLFAKVYYVWKNKIRDKKWNAMTREEQVHYILTTKDKNSRRLDFRFAH